MSLEHGSMGFLSMKPLSGYDIKKLFDMSAGYFWPADQTQTYRTLKNLEKEGLVAFQGQLKGETVDRKVYAITEAGRTAYFGQIQQNSVEDFISRDMFLLQLFFSGALPVEEQLELIDRQLQNIKALERQLTQNYEENYDKFLDRTGMSPDDRRLQSAVFAHRWGFFKCKAYAKLLKEIKQEIQQKIKEDRKKEETI